MRNKMFAGADKQLFEKAAKLRNQQTFAEELLWNHLGTKPLGFKFRRQHAFSNYILDYYCHTLNLGSIHEIEEIKKHDKERQEWLEQEGLTVLRFTNNEIKLQPEEVIQKIEKHLQSKVGAAIRRTPTT
jgi:very-short-patch-repair endonuclease